MKQLFQNLKTGETFLEEIPTPTVTNGHVLIKSACSLISLGTERMLVDFSRANLIKKARLQPDKVKQVIDKIKTDGIKSTMHSILSRLDEPIALGYCNAGIVIAVGEDVENIKIGDRVTSNGPHAEVVSVPKNLVVKIPDSITFEEASFTVIGSIGLEGLRLANPTLGETVVIIGLGLVGQLTSQLALANGCNVIGFDIDDSKVEIAKKLDITAFKTTEYPEKIINEITNGTGSDIVLITASSKNNEIISQAAKMCRKRGRIILVGVVGLDINRSDFYEKELSFQVSCSYGPGRYDPIYEQKGIDYPLPYVRWTENRNFETILNFLKTGNLKVKELITKKITFHQAQEHYKTLSESDSIATIFTYAHETTFYSTVSKIYTPDNFPKGTDVPTLAIIGSGNFTKITLAPLLKKMNCRIKYICSKNGASSTHLAKKYNFENSTTDFKEVLKDGEVDAVIITTRHNLHASMCIESLKAQKHVFVEKPLAISKQELESIIQAKKECKKSLIVGFNRRFSPFVIKAKEFYKDTPINAVLTFNAGFIPKTHWTQDLEVSGGRIVGEACHFIDLFAYLSGSPIVSICASCLGKETDGCSDNVSILLKSKNGSQGVINYFSNGSKSFPKERIQLFAQDTIVEIDNFQSLTGFGIPGFKKLKLYNQDKGHKSQFEQLLHFISHGGRPPIPFDEIVNSTEAAFAVLESLKKCSWINI